jgi:type 1 glutamine amidotransferase
MWYNRPDTITILEGITSMKKVVAIVGDFYHDVDLAKESLLTALSSFIEEKRIELKFALVTQISEELMSRPDLVILFAEDRIDPQVNPDLKWMTKDVSDQIVSYVEQGGAWFGWHSGLASYDEESSYVGMLRGYFLSHPKDNQPVTYTSDKETVFGETVQPFGFLDEHYMVFCDEPNTNVFLRSASVDGESIAGWHHTFGKGLVCCLTPAHRREGLMDPTFIRILRNSISWTASL